ncbi:MAG: OmpA family protein [Bacteroidota bacterium]|nr:OmpA family protein [Bacteroidota bacterium]
MRAYQMNDLAKCESILKKAIEADPGWVEPYLLLSDVYRKSNRPEDEKKVYEEMIIKIPGHFAGYYNLAFWYSSNAKYPEAIENYKKVIFLSDVPAPLLENARSQVPKLEAAQKLLSNPVPFKPVNAGEGINTRNDEYFPSLTVNGNMMFFSRMMLDAQGRRVAEDLMVSEKNEGTWQPADAVPPPVNTELNEGAMAISPDGCFMIYTACNRGDGYGGCDLYISFYRDGQWSKPVNMGEPVNTRFKETQPTISFDGSSVYFASDRPGTLGQLDIWMSARGEDGRFGEPINLGSTINTTDHEQSPFIHPDNQTLYFCSRGHNGLGANDIFYAHRADDGSWQEAINIGYPINTPGDEPGLMVEPGGQYAYMSSSSASIGGLDIFYFELHEEARPNAVTYLQGKVFDAYTRQAKFAVFELVDLETGETVLKSAMCNEGSFLVPIPAGKDYLLNVSTQGYLFYSEYIPLKTYKNPKPFIQDIPLYPVKPGEKVALRNIFFDTDKFDLKPESRAELVRLAAFLKANPTVKIEIGGHTDNTGSSSGNQVLSQNRAKAVYDYLVNDAGIAPSRLSYKGYGASKPIAENTTEEGKAKNRRTEITVMQ